MAKKILLLYPPIINQVAHINIGAFDKSIGSYPPLGLLYIATYLKKFTSYDVEILDCFVEKLDFNQIKARIKAADPDVVGISGMTHFWIDVCELAKITKEVFPNVKVVVGGPHATIYPVSVVKFAHIDYAISGEAEVTFTALLDSIFKGASEEEIAKLPGIAGKWHLKERKTNENIEIQRISDTNSIPFPDRALVDHSRYFSFFAPRGTFTTLMTSRGCPFNCIFCERMGRGFRPVSAQNVLREIKASMKLGIKNFFIHDDTFTVDKKRVKDICEAIIQEGLTINWEARSRVDCVDYELLKLMHRSGASRLSFGVESGNEKVLEGLRKGIKLPRVKEVFGWCRQLGITTLADFMIGSPGEGVKEIDDTLRFVKTIRPDYAQFCITCPYPATPLYKKLLEEGKISSDVWLEFVENPTLDFIPPIASEYFNREQLKAFVIRAYKKSYFTLPFIIKEMRKISSPELLLSRMKTAISLCRGS